MRATLAPLPLQQHARCQDAKPNTVAPFVLTYHSTVFVVLNLSLLRCDVSALRTTQAPAGCCACVDLSPQ